MAYGINKNGFKLKTFLNIIQEIEDEYKVKLNKTDYKIDMYTPEGIHTETIANQLKELWEELLELVNNSFLETASGIWLDKFGYLLGIERKQGRIATGQVKIIGAENTVIPINTEIKLGNLIYFTNETTTLEKVLENDKYFSDIYISAERFGDVHNKTSGTEFSHSIKDVEKIYAITGITGGSFSESDSDYRQRLKEKRDIEKVATHSAITNAIKKMDNINDVLILTPDTTPATESGTIKIYVDGTPNDSIFDIIGKTKSAGILTLQDDQATHFSKKILIANVLVNVTYNKISTVIPKITVKVYDVVGGEKNIKWTQPIKDKIKNYINNLKIGEKLEYLELYAEIRGIYEIRKIELLITVDEVEQPQPKTWEFEKVFTINTSKRFSIADENITVEYEE